MVCTTVCDGFERPYHRLQQHANIFLAAVKSCGHLQLFLVQRVQICTCFLLLWVCLYKKQLQVTQRLDNY